MLLSHAIWCMKVAMYKGSIKIMYGASLAPFLTTLVICTGRNFEISLRRCGMAHKNEWITHAQKNFFATMA